MPKATKGYVIKPHESVKRMLHLGVGNLHAAPGFETHMTEEQYKAWSTTVAFKKMTGKRARGKPPLLTVARQGEVPKVEADAEEEAE